jgi:hypothetical protein
MIARCLAALAFWLFLPLMASAQIFGVPNSLCLCAVATRAAIPALFNSTNKQVMAQSEHILQDNVTSLQLVFWNGYIDTSNNTNTYTELGTGSPMTVTFGICTTPTASSCTSFQCSGSVTCTAPDNGIITTDPLVFSGTLGQVIYIRTWTNSASGIIYFTQGNASLGDRLRLGASGITDQTAGGTISNDNPNWSLPPVGIIANTRASSFYLLGTSRTSGVNDTIDASGNIGIQARSIGVGSAYINGGVGGYKVSQFVLSNSHQAVIANGYYRSIGIELGVNDTTSDATTEANLQTAYSIFPTKRIYGVTIDPDTTFPGNVSVKSFATLNAYLRAKPNPLYGIFDVDSVMENGSSGIWSNIANTLDGLHESYQGNLIIKASGVVPP